MSNKGMQVSFYQNITICDGARVLINKSQAIKAGVTVRGVFEQILNSKNEA